jgi:hypothetical protein
MHKVTSSNSQAFFILIMNGVPEMNRMSKSVPTVYCSYQDVTDHAVTILYIHRSNVSFRIPTRKKQVGSDQENMEDRRAMCGE